MCDHDHTFVRMRRIKAIRCLQSETASFPAKIVVKYMHRIMNQILATKLQENHIDRPQRTMWRKYPKLSRTLYQFGSHLSTYRPRGDGVLTILSSIFGTVLTFCALCVRSREHFPTVARRYYQIKRSRGPASIVTDVFQSLFFCAIVAIAGGGRGRCHVVCGANFMSLSLEKQKQLWPPCDCIYIMQKGSSGGWWLT